MISGTFTRERLHDRHRLSHQQIDGLLGENRSREFMAEKMQVLSKIRYFIQIIDLLQQNKIGFICLKGPVLSQQLYGDPSLRLSHDVDILLTDRSDMIKVDGLLTELDYVGVDDLSWPEEVSRQKILMDCVHHLAYEHNANQFMVEIHWSVSEPFPLKAKIFSKIVENNRQQIAFGGREVTVFAPELNLLYLIIHGSIHGWQRLKWLVDIKDFPFETINADRWHGLVKQLKAGRMVSQTGFLLNHFFQINQPLFVQTPIPRLLKSYPLTFIDKDVLLQRPISDSFAGTRYKFLLCNTLSYKLRAFLTSAIIPIDFSRIKSSSRIVYFIYRPYSYIKRRLNYAK
jgi:hypothetical protein